MTTIPRSKLKKVQRKVSRALKDETKAAKFYTLLRNATLDDIKIADMINEIRNDEIDHHDKLMQIRSMLR